MHHLARRTRSFSTFLVPGHFTAFRTYANVVKATIAELERAVEVELERAGSEGAGGGDAGAQLDSEGVELVLQVPVVAPSAHL